MKVKLQEVIDALHSNSPSLRWSVAADLEQHGIAVDYVPMTDDEFGEMMSETLIDPNEDFAWERVVEQAVLNRLGVAPTLKHKYWMAGESGCPAEIKASNGELHTLRCKVCGKDNDKNPCRGER